MLRHRSLQQRKGLLTRWPSEKMEVSNPLPQRQGAGGILWDKTEANWRQENVRWSSFWPRYNWATGFFTIRILRTCSADGVFSPLKSKGHGACPVGGLMVLTGSSSNRTDYKFLKQNKTKQNWDKHFIVYTTWHVEGTQVFIVTKRAWLVKTVYSLLFING